MSKNYICMECLTEFSKKELVFIDDVFDDDFFIELCPFCNSKDIRFLGYYSKETKDKFKSDNYLDNLKQATITTNDVMNVYDIDTYYPSVLNQEIKSAKEVMISVENFNKKEYKYNYKQILKFSLLLISFILVFPIPLYLFYVIKYKYLKARGYNKRVNELKKGRLNK